MNDAGLSLGDCDVKNYRIGESVHTAVCKVA